MADYTVTTNGPHLLTLSGTEIDTVSLPASPNTGRSVAIYNNTDGGPIKCTVGRQGMAPSPIERPMGKAAFGTYVALPCPHSGPIDIKLYGNGNSYYVWRTDTSNFGLDEILAALDRTIWDQTAQGTGTSLDPRGFNMDYALGQALSVEDASTDDSVVAVHANGSAYRALLADSHQLKVRALSGTASVALTDEVLVCTTGGNWTLTLMDPAICTGRVFYIKKLGASNTLTISGSIDGASSITLTTQYTVAALVSDGTTYHRLV